MKSLNVKKVVSAAAGGALVAAAFAGAVTVDPSIENFNFFDNGEPNVKIVVGSKAQIWDGVAAGNIAAMVGNLAYSDQDVVAGAGTGGNGTAGGSVTGKSVTLEVTTPSGSSGQTGTAIVSTQLFDFMDNDVKTATTNRDDDAATALIGDGITSGGYYYSNTLYPDVVFKGSVSNLGSYNVVQEDGYYVTAANYYDFTEDAHVADRVRISYITNFTDALPYHVDIVNGSTAGRASNDDKVTENRNIKIKFLGRDFVVTDFENGTSTTAPTVSLGEAAVFRQMKAGESVTLGEKQLKLVSISPIATGSGTLPFAYFEVLNKDGTRLDYFSMSKDTSNYNKNGIILDVRDVFVGGGDTSYTEVAVYGSSLTLKDGEKITFEGDDATTKLNQDASWTVNLAFQNLVVGGEAQRTLKQIRVSGPTSTRIKAGKSFNLIEKPISKVLTFLGIESVDRDTLTLTARGRQTPQRITNASGDPAPVGANIDVNVTELKSGYASAFNVGGKNYDTLWLDEYNGRILVYDSTASQANHTTASDIADNTVDYFYPATTASTAIRLTTNFTRPGPLGARNTSHTTGGYNNTAAVNYLVSYNDTAGGESLPAIVGVTFDGGSAAGGVVLGWTAVPGANGYTVYSQNATNTYRLGYVGAAASPTYNTSSQAFAVEAGVTLPNASARNARLRIFEPIVDNSASLNGWFSIDLFAADSNYIYNSSTSTTTLTTTYATTVSPGTTPTNWPGTGFNVEQGFVSPGGAILKSLSLSQAVVEYPKKLAHARFQFGAATQVVNVTSTGNVISTKTLAEAESYTLGSGYSVKVSSIGGSAVCSGGGVGAGTCTPDKAAVVTQLNTAADKLVVLDSEASGAGQAIVVGGPFVNSVAANTPGVAEVTSKPGDSVIKVIGGKVIVAGYTAQDTQDAANELINWLAQNRDTVRG